MVQVGPLPASLDGDTTAEMLYKPGEIPWHKRPSSDMAERSAMVRFPMSHEDGATLVCGLVPWPESFKPKQTRFRD